VFNSLIFEMFLCACVFVISDSWRERLEKLRDDFVGRVGLYVMERLWLYCYFCNS
jgi:hypothetical protein